MSFAIPKHVVEINENAFDENIEMNPVDLTAFKDCRIAIYMIPVSLVNRSKSKNNAIIYRR